MRQLHLPGAASGLPAQTRIAVLTGLVAAFLLGIVLAQRFDAGELRITVLDCGALPETLPHQPLPWHQTRPGAPRASLPGTDCNPARLPALRFTQN